MTAVLGGNGHLLIDDILDETAARVCIYITSNLLELFFSNTTVMQKPDWTLVIF